MLRGGAWDSDAPSGRVACRKTEFPGLYGRLLRGDSNGFRRVKNAVLPKAGLRSRSLRRPVPAPEDEEGSGAALTTPAPTAGKTIPGLKGTIVFVSDRSGALEIWRMHPSGKDQKQLTKEGTPHADPK